MLESSFFFFRCVSRTYRRLDNVGLTGTISTAVGLLTALTGLCATNDGSDVMVRLLHFNQLSGTIPSTVGLLTSLEEL